MCFHLISRERHTIHMQHMETLPFVEHTVQLASTEMTSWHFSKFVRMLPQAAVLLNGLHSVQMYSTRSSRSIQTALKLLHIFQTQQQKFQQTISIGLIESLPPYQTRTTENVLHTLSATNRRYSHKAMRLSMTATNSSLLKQMNQNVQRSVKMQTRQLR